MHLTSCSSHPLFVQVQRQGFCLLAASSGAGQAMTASSIVEEFYAVQQPATYNMRYSEALKVQAGAVSDSSMPEQVTVLFSGGQHTQHIHKAIHLRVCLEAVVSCIKCQSGELLIAHPSD